MGLDQFLYKVKTEMSTYEYYKKLDELDLDEYGFYDEEQYDALNKSINRIEIAEWRKFYKLDNYCTSLYKARNNDDEFNCKYLELNSDDIQNIIEKFGYDEYTLKRMKEALIYINKGYRIWYSNSY